MCKKEFSKERKTIYFELNFEAHHSVVSRNENNMKERWKVERGGGGGGGVINDHRERERETKENN